MDDSKRSIDMKTCCGVFLNKWAVLSHFFVKSNIFKYVSPCQTRSNEFWIMNAMCTFVYVFVVYFSFAPVISANIHRYVNYFDIQVLMMVTETETLTSTLHHNIFTYLDYVLGNIQLIKVYIFKHRVNKSSTISVWISLLFTFPIHFYSDFPLDLPITDNWYCLDWLWVLK